MIQDNGHSCGMLMMLLPVELCQNYVSGLIYVLCSPGPSFGYHPEPTASFVVINDQWKNEAAAIFHDLGIQVVTGHRFLGGFIGNHSKRDEYVMSKV